MIVSSIFVTAFLAEIALADPWVKLTSDGPVVLDATISFRAELKDIEDYDPPYYFTWSKFLALRLLLRAIT